MSPTSDVILAADASGAVALGSAPAATDLNPGIVVNDFAPEDFASADFATGAPAPTP